MTRWRQPGAGEILLAYLVLAAVACSLSWLSHGFGLRDPVSAFLVIALLVWRVSRGGQLSRAVLVIGSVVAYAEAVLAVARLWDLTVAALVIVCAGLVVLAVSPPVYARTRRPLAAAVRARWASLIDRPSASLLLLGALAGVLLTLACLGSMGFVVVPGCRPITSDACSALAEGYPLRWLTALQNTPEISKGALFKDCAQWTLVATSVLYLARLTQSVRLNPRDELPDAAASDPM